MQLRAPLPAEAPALSELLMRSKASVGYDDAFMALCGPFLTVDPRSWGLPQLAEDGALLGYVEIPPGDARLSHLFIAPEAQRRGVGRALLGWALDTAHAEGCPSLTLAADPAAVAFYEAFGARVTGTIPSEIAGARPLPEMKFHL